jgi:2-(1,2-epoxy-1,2-dihydrophenyl)acetyl-CoA isomerase
MESEFVTLKNENGIATVTMSRPSIRNAMDSRMAIGIADAFGEIKRDNSVKVVVYCGEGQAFCAGGDIKDLKRMHDTQTVLETRSGERELMLRVLGSIYNLEKPVIAMVRGPAVGAGCNLALACDIIIASENATFGELFMRMGLASDFGGSYLLPRLVGMARAKEIYLTGRIVDAKEAERIGMINRVVPDVELEKQSYALARQMADGPTRALGIIKSQLNAAVDTNLEAALEMEGDAFGILIHSEDHAEAAKAFFEKRPPKFQGR